MLVTSEFDGMGVAGGGVVVLFTVLFFFFYILGASVANTCLLLVIIAKFNKAIIAEEWQTFISSCISASQCQGGYFKTGDLIKAMARRLEVSF